MASSSTDTETIIPTKYNTEVDMDLPLKKELKQLFPKLDGLAFDIGLQYHRKLVALYGEDYSPELIEQMWKQAEKLKISA